MTFRNKEVLYPIHKYRHFLESLGFCPWLLNFGVPVKLEVVDGGIEAVLRRPHLYMGSTHFCPQKVMGIIAFQAFCLGATKVELSNDGDWWRLASDFDWISMSDVIQSPGYLFEKIVAEPRFGQNSIYSEIVMAAFSKSIAVDLMGKRAFEKLSCSSIPEQLMDNKRIPLVYLFEAGAPTQLSCDVDVS